MAAWEGYQLVAFDWFMVASSFILVVGRLYVQWSLRPRIPWFEIFPVLAVIGLAGSAIVDSISNDYDLYQEFYTPPPWIQSAEEYDTFMQVPLQAQYAAAFTTRISIYACKFALLCFYMELSNCLKGVRKVIYITWVVNAGVLIAQFIWLFAMCKPISENWKFSYFGSDKQCSRTKTFIMFSLSTHIVTDIMVFVIPFFIVRKLTNLSYGQKVCAGVMFGLGFINVALAIICTVLDLKMDTFKIAGAYFFMTELQFGSAIWLVTFPYLRRLFIGLGKLKRGEDIVGRVQEGLGDEYQREKYGAHDIESEAISGSKDSSGGSPGTTKVDISVDEKR